MTLRTSLGTLAATVLAATALAVFAYGNVPHSSQQLPLAHAQDESTSLEDKLVAQDDAGRALSLPEIDPSSYHGFIISQAGNSVSEKVRYSISVANGDMMDLGQGCYAVESIEDAERYLSARDVAYIEPDYVVTAAGYYANEAAANAAVPNAQGYENASGASVSLNPNDPLFQGVAVPSGYLKQTELRTINVQEAWRRASARKDYFGDVVVAVIDSGVDTNNPDLMGRLVEGKTFIEGKSSVSPNVDTTGHGTHCSLVIAAASDNGYGGAGIAPNAKIMPYKVSVDGDMTTSDIILAVNDAIGTHSDSRPDVDVINMSLGSPGYSRTFEYACNNARNAGIILVAAAGNENYSFNSYPASFSSVIGVAATSPEGEFSAGLSNYNSDLSNIFNYYNAANGADNVYVAAPGEDIVFPGSSAGSYTHESGTSFASPAVAGLAAIAKGYSTACDDSYFRYLLRLSSQDKGDAGFDKLYGWGVIDAGALVATLEEKSGLFNDLADASISLDQEVFCYSSSRPVAQKPTFTVRLGGSILAEGRDFFVTWPADMVNPGEKKVTLEGRGAYTGTTGFSYYIDSPSFADAQITAHDCQYLDLDYTSVRQDGVRRTSNVEVTMNGHALGEGEDYEIAYDATDDYLRIGTHTLRVSPKGGFYKGSPRSVTYRITKADLANADIKMPEESHVYTSTGICPEPASVIWGSKVLARGVDYTLSWEENVNAGTARVIVTGMGDYFEGAQSAPFTIKPASINEASIGPIENLTYTGRAQTPELDVTLGGKKLVGGVDYYVGYNNSTNAGTATAVVRGMGNYTGAVTGTFTIGPASIGDLVLDDVPAMSYTGEAVKPGVTLRWPDRTVVPNYWYAPNYTLSYENNVEYGKSAKVIITGKGNFTGTRTATFEICKANLATAGGNFTFTNNQTYNGKQIVVEKCEIWDENGKTLERGVDYELEYGENVNAGKGAGSIKIVSLREDVVGENLVTFEIYPCPIEIPNAVTGLVYDGTSHLGVPGGEHYAITDNVATDAGRHMARATTDPNYCWANTNSWTEIGIYYTIEAKSLANAKIASIPNQTYTGKVIEPTPAVTLDGKRLVAGKDFEYSYQQNKYEGTAYVHVMGMGNYKDSASATFNIVPITSGQAGTPTGSAAQASLSTATIDSIPSRVYNGKAYTPVPKVTLNGGVLREGTDYTVSYKTPAGNVTFAPKNAGTYTLVVTGKGAYAGTAKRDFAITKAANSMSTAVLAKAFKASKKDGKLPKAKSFMIAAKFKGAPLVMYKVSSYLKTGKTSKANVKKYVKVSSAGKVTIGKGTPKGTYRFKVKITAKAMTNYKAKSVTKVITVRVK